MSVLDTLKGASKARRSVTLCLDAALQAEWEAAREKLPDAVALDEKNGSLAFEATRKATDDMEEVRDRMKASEATFVMEMLEWPARLKLQAEHPPREKNLADSVRGYNLETYVPAVIRESCVSVTDASGDETSDVPGEVWEHLFRTLNFSAMDRLSGAAVQVNDGETLIPPSARSLLESQDSGASLAQPSPGTSPQSGSEGGSRRGSRKSSATKKAASVGS